MRSGVNKQHRRMAMYLVWTLLFLPGVLGGTGGVDLTMAPGASGTAVVKAVVDRIRSNCILGDDRLFLRRLAYVETTDGTDSKTYRSGYDGGIWQIDESKFLETKTCPLSIAAECNKIQSSFNIDWRSTSWTDLRKPLYSGLAAALFIKKYNSSSPPGDVTSQASFWVSRLRPNGSESGFVTKARTMTGTDCRTQLDLAFILDGSGSVSISDFRRMLDFITDVVSKLDISEDGVKVSTVEYASTVGGDILFKDFTTKDRLLNSTSTIRKSGGGTNTSAAILHTVDVLFSSAAGARPNAKRVAILLTDGRSNSKTATISAAQKAKAAGITMISVGIGNADVSELRGVATQPYCTHVIILSSFREIDSLLYQLKDSSCGALTAVKKNKTINTPLPLNKTVEDSFEFKDDNLTTPIPGKDKAVVGEVVCGTLVMYASYNIPRPGPAFYDVKDTARDGKPGIIFFNKTMQGRQLYITVLGTRLSVSLAQMASCVNASFSVRISQQTPKTRVICKEGEKERQCSRKDLEDNGYNCDDTYNVSNPCFSGNACNHAHPSDSTKFIRCDLKGNMFETQCPGKTQYNPDTISCGSEPVEGGISCNVTNPCTPANIARHRFDFPYPPNPSKYIQCDAFGKLWMRDCPSGTFWNEGRRSCSSQSGVTTTLKPSTLRTSTPSVSPVSNNCNGSNNGAMFPHTDASKFIMCDHGAAVVMSCPPSLKFDVSINRCNHG